MTRDPFAGYMVYPSSQNGYSYVYNNPLLYTDPSGEIVPLLAVAGVGFLIGAGGDLLVQMMSNGWNLRCVDLKEVLVSGVVGAVSGVTGFALAGVLAAGFGTGLVATIASGAIVGAATGIVSRGVTNALTGQDVLDGVFDPKAILRDALIGGVTAGLGYGIQRLLKPITGRTLSFLRTKVSPLSEKNLVSAREINWSQRKISAFTKRDNKSMMLDDLALDMANGWRGDPLDVLDVDGVLVSLDNRRLAVAKLLDIDVPVRVTRVESVIDWAVYKRDGLFSNIEIRDADMIIDMLGKIKFK